MEWPDCVGCGGHRGSPAHAESFAATRSATMIVVAFVNEQTLICVADGSLSARAGRRPRSIISLTKLSHAVMLALKPIPSHLGDVGSNQPDKPGALKSQAFRSAPPTLNGFSGS